MGNTMKVKSTLGCTCKNGSGMVDSKVYIRNSSAFKLLEFENFKDKT